MKSENKTDIFIEKAKKIHGDQYDYSQINYVNNRTKIKIICPVHGAFLQIPYNHLKKRQGCTHCGRERSNNAKRKTVDTFIKEARKVHGGKYDYSKVEYKGTNIGVVIICPIHGEFEQTPHNHLANHGCLKCGIERTTLSQTSNTEEFIERSKKLHGDIYDYSKVNYVSSGTKVEIICSVHGSFFQVPTTHLIPRGCEKCGYIKTANTQRSNKEEFIKKARVVHGDKYVYSKVVYVSARDKVEIICKEHGMFKQSPDTHLGGSGCSICSSSEGEQRVYEVLRKLELGFIHQYSLPNSKLRYDYYIKDLNILIEYDGAQHFKPIEHFGGEKAFRERQRNDKIKTDMAEGYNIPLIRLHYTSLQYIEETLMQELSKIYKYKVGDRWYKTFRMLCKGEKLPDSTTSKDVKNYLVSRISV